MNWTELRGRILDVVGSAFYFSTVALSSADGQTDALEGRSESNEQSYQIPVRRLWPFGLRSRPPVGVDAISVRRGGRIMVGAESAQYGPSDLEEGELGLYCLADGTLVKLTKVGKIAMNAASGQDITITTAGAGNITITAGGSGKITLDATGTDLELKAKTITMTADDVDVTVTNAMDVHG